MFSFIEILFPKLDGLTSIIIIYQLVTTLYVFALFFHIQQLA